jgi:aryl-alcohol dehydrogenase-like predicted oxidoreductase
LRPNCSRLPYSTPPTPRKPRPTFPAGFLAWVLSHAEITVAISGADTFDQLDQNLGALDLALDTADREQLDAVSTNLSMILD